jgi:hypothetical protein
MMAPRTGLEREQLVEVDTLQMAIDLNPDFSPVVVDERGDASLRSFTHPDRALYLFGRTGISPLEALAWRGLSVHIEGAGPLGMLHPHQAAAITLYDRQVKSWL